MAEALAVVGVQGDTAVPAVEGGDHGFLLGELRMNWVKYA
jgi:hypothetical protein